MKFSISVNMERYDADTDMRTVAADALTLVQMAEQGGFETVWAAEHHTIELLVAPNPFTILTHWAAHTTTIRLGTAVVVAPYWHPIRVAGEAALIDLLSGGRLEFGISRGAFQYEFDRMAGGIPQQQGGAYMHEMLPAVRALWRGDYEHNGTLWRFPAATSVPKPLQQPHPPIWVAARDPASFEWAMAQDAHIMATPLSRPHAEVGILGQRFQDTLARFPGRKKPRFLMLRRTCVYDRSHDWRFPVEASINYARRFETLFRNIGGVKDGFPEACDLDQLAERAEFQPEAIRDAMVFGTPDEVIAKLESYRAAGVDQFCYGANFGLPPAMARRSLELFITKVMPHFTRSPAPRKPAITSPAGIV